MPTYEFRCPSGHTFDRFMKMSEAVAELPCPECGEQAARQMSGGAGLVFKGSGFYLTDYGRNAHRSSGAKPSGSATSGGESKPAAGESKGSGAGSTGSSGGSAASSSGGSSSSGSGGSGAGGTK